jgi:hypothetical protein
MISLMLSGSTDASTGRTAITPFKKQRNCGEGQRTALTPDARHGTTMTGARQKATFCPFGSRTVT